MRKLFITAAGLLLSSLFVAQVSFAQDYANHNPLPKSVLVSFMSPENETDKNLKTVSVDANLKLQKSFNRQFKEAGQVAWYNLGKKFLAEFNYQGRKTTALYTKNGYNIYAFAHSTEKDLPKNYRKMLKSMYVDFDILHAVEIKVPEIKDPVWLAYLQSEEHIVIARIIEGGFDEYARYDTKPKDVKKQRRGRVIIPKT